MPNEAARKSWTASKRRIKMSCFHYVSLASPIFHLKVIIDYLLNTLIVAVSLSSFPWQNYRSNLTLNSERIRLQFHREVNKSRRLISSWQTTAEMTSVLSPFYWLQSVKWTSWVFWKFHLSSIYASLFLFPKSAVDKRNNCYILKI